MANSADPDQKPTDLDLHCLQRQGISGFSRTRVNYHLLSPYWEICTCITVCVSSAPALPSCLVVSVKKIVITVVCQPCLINRTLSFTVLFTVRFMNLIKQTLIFFCQISFLLGLISLWENYTRLITEFGFL